jgi:hypothetical protein
MLTDWYRGTKGEAQKTERAREVRSSLPTLRILKSILEGKLEQLELDHAKKDKYDSPSWAFLQADYVGNKRCLQEIIQLLTSVEEKHE